MQSNARLVIIGGGIVGCSAAYYLMLKGWTDIVVVEQGPLFEAGGSTSHAPGLVFQINASRTMCKLSQWTVGLYRELELEGQPCFYSVGSVEIAYSPERLEDLKRKLGNALSWGVPASLIASDEVKRLIPIMNVERVHGAFHVPSDGIAKAVRAGEALAAQATSHGASFHARTTVTSIETANDRVKAVVTDRGTIQTENVLVCTGIWGPRIGRMVGVSIPLTPVQHQYAKTAPLNELVGEKREVVHPVLRHQDRSMYFRQQGDCYGIGSYQHEPLLLDAERIRKHGETPAQPAIEPFTEQHFRKPYNDALELFPCLRGAELPYKINGMFSFTPDGNPVVGESLDVRGFWVAEAVWVTHAGGVGRAVADLMSTGGCELDLRELDINRFHAHVASSAYIRARGAQQYREVYDIIHPVQPISEPRGLRVTPFHHRLEELGAVFFESAGWERPQWFAANEKLGTRDIGPGRSGWAAKFWSPIIGAEHKAVRERVGLFDLTPFTKMELSGHGALALLQKLCANQMDVAPGKVVYTAMLTEKGGIKCDLTVTRLSESRFLVVTGGSVGMHDLAWIRAQLPVDESVQLTDITSSRCCVGVWGPRARLLMQSICENDLSNEKFPYFTAQPIFIKHVPAFAIRISYAGELGWEVYAPVEYGQYLWDTLWAAGQPLGVVAAGGGAFDSLRLEKGYRLWGADIHTEYNPFEAGLGFAVKMKKGDFIGRVALEKIKARGLTRKLCCVTFDDPKSIVMGKEPVYHGDNIVGYVTSANYGYTVNKTIMYSYLPNEASTEGTKVSVHYFGNRLSATVTKEPVYDPENAKLKG